MEVSSKVTNILSALKELYPDALCSLDYEKDYELLFSVRLAAQCTDARVNLVTPALFARYPTLEAFAAADVAIEALHAHWLPLRIAMAESNEARLALDAVWWRSLDVARWYRERLKLL